MAQKVYTVEGRQFRTEKDYARAKRDKELIDKLRGQINLRDKKELEKLRTALRGSKYKFQTLLGQDFLEEIEGMLKTANKPGRDIASNRTRDSRAAGGVRAGNNVQKGHVLSGHNGTGAQNDGLSGTPPGDDKAIDAIVAEELRKRERRRKITVALCSMVAVCCLGYFGIYAYFNYKTENAYQELSELKDQPVTVAADRAAAAMTASTSLYTLDGEPEAKEVLEEYKNLLIKNKRLIGWIKIDDTNIDYPVMQTVDNEFYLDHDVNQNYDKNGSIFMDKDCDVLKPSTNYILYGHHMKNGQMFGYLDRYQKESYYKEHPYISFDTIYEKGTYEVMYVFRSKVYKETEIVFKYYQFIDANGEQEFDSAMQEMAAMSLYDTGVTAQYGDQLLTLSTCDYQETDGRFVVVAKKIAKE